MRIAMIGSRGIPARLGGVERVVEDLAHGLCARGHEVLVYGREHYLRDAPAPMAGQSRLTPGWAHPSLDALSHSATACWDVLRRDVDVIHIHSPGPALGSLLPALAGRAVVFTVHAPDWQREKFSRPGRMMIRAGLCAGMACALSVTAVSAHLAGDLSCRFDRRVRHVPNGIAPPAQAGDAMLRRWNLLADGYALHVGRVVPEKRLRLLLSAWAKAEVAVPLVVAGDVDRSAYGRRCRAEAPEGVLFLGPCLGRDIAELYAHAALVIQPSVLEGASLVLLEAASHGRCILSVDMPANREILDDTGLYFTADRELELARQIRRCFRNDSARSELGHLARQRVLQEFPLSRTMEGMEAAYCEALRGAER